MTQLSPICNVFGFLHAPVGLQSVAAALCSRLGLTGEQIWLKRSWSDGRETLQMETELYSLETSPSETPGTWLFNGEVAGNVDEIFATLLPLVENLSAAGFSATFEIYDAAFRLLGTCPR